MNPKNLKYTKDHEWARVEGKNAVIGITEFAAKNLGDIVFVDIPKPGTKLEKGKTIGVVESVKTVSDIFAPLSGKVVKGNADLEADPSLANQDPYGKGWIIEIEMSSKGEADELMDSAAYDKFCETAGHGH